MQSTAIALTRPHGWGHTMNILCLRRVATTALAAAVSALPILATPLAAQAPAVVTRLVAEPARVSIQAGQAQPFKVTAYDASGKVMPDAVVRVGGPRGAVMFTGDEVRAFRAGSYTAVATASNPPGTAPVTLEIPVIVELARTDSHRYRSGARPALHGRHARALGQGLSRRRQRAPRSHGHVAQLTDAVASVDRFGNVTALKAGTVTITAESTASRRRSATRSPRIPVTSIELDITETSDAHRRRRAPQGACADAPTARAVADAPITWSYTYTPDDTHGRRPAARASSTTACSPPTIRAATRSSRSRRQRGRAHGDRGDAARRAAAHHGHRPRHHQHDAHTSDLWPWTGKDGRDYCLVGTWGGDGYALVFDITDLNNIVKTDSIKVDARTINDVTVSPDGRYGVLSREGASNRVNGVVILDLANPAHPKVASTFDQELTGGVHNMFATNDHLFAVSGGAEVRDHRREGHLQAEVRQRVPAPERAPPRPLGARRHRVLGAGRRRHGRRGRRQRQVRRHDREAEAHHRVPDQQRPRDLSRTSRSPPARRTSSSATRR